MHEDYAASRASLRSAIEDLVAWSVSLNGTPSRDGRDYWSSILLAKLTLTSMTLDKIVPRSAAKEDTALWDMTSVAALVRILAENYLLFFWLCVETDTKELWDLRITLLTIADNRSRYRLTGEVEGEPEPEDFLSAQQALAARLQTMPSFRSLPARRQRELLKGDKTPFIQDDVIDALPIDRLSFRRFYRYLSSFVHTGTVSFFRMEAHARGQGEFNLYEATAMQAAIDFSVLIIEAAVSNGKAIHGRV